MDIFTFNVLIEIRDCAFGTKTTCSDKVEVVSEDTMDMESEQVFSVSNIQDLNNVEQENLDIIFRKSSKEDESFWKDINEELIINPIRKQLVYSAWLNRKPTKGELNIDQAKKIPISSLLSFNRYNKVRCIFHDDKNPSLQYYPNTNTVYCWSCKEWGDSIKVYQKLYNKTFKQAVLALQ